MVALKIGTAEHELAFGKVLDSFARFDSAMPSHQELQNAWSDPSIRVALGLDQPNRLLAKQTMDLREGGRMLLYDLASNFGTEAGKIVNFPTDLLSGLRATVQSSPIASSKTKSQV